MATLRTSKSLSQVHPVYKMELILSCILFQAKIYFRKWPFNSGIRCRSQHFLSPEGKGLPECKWCECHENVSKWFRSHGFSQYQSSVESNWHHDWKHASSFWRKPWHNATVESFGESNENDRSQPKSKCTMAIDGIGNPCRWDCS